MNKCLALSCCWITFLIVTPAGCSRVSDSVSTSSNSLPAATASQLADFNEALVGPAFSLFRRDWMNEFADAVKESFGSDKASLARARNVRDELLAELESGMGKIQAIPTPYVPEAWAFRQACRSFLGTMRDISSTHMDEILTIAADDSLDSEQKMDRCGKIHLRQKKLMVSAESLLDEAGEAWEVYMNGKSATN